MTTISERLRDAYHIDRSERAEIADTFDALVWVLDKMGDKTIGEYELDVMRRAALAKAKGKQE